MTTIHVNEPAPAATVPQILARLILVQQHHELPDPVGMSAADNRAEVNLASRAAFDAWLAALGGKDAFVHGTPLTNGRTLFWANIRDWHGPWGVELELELEEPGATELDADTVAGLEEVAAKQEIAVSDDEHEPTFVRCESTDESNCCRCRLPADHRPGCRFVRLDRDEVSA